MTGTTVGGLIAGVTNEYEFVPAIFFAGAYGLVLFAYLGRFTNKKSEWTCLNSGSASAVIERIIQFCLRAVVCRTPGDESEGLTEYLQLGTFMATSALLADLNTLLRAVTIEAIQKDSDPQPEPSSVETKTISDVSTRTLGTSWSASTVVEALRPPSLEHRLKRYRLFSDTLLITIYSVLGMGILGTSLCISQRNEPSKAILIMALRELYNSVIMLVLLLLTCWAVWTKIHITVAARPINTIIIFLALLFSPLLYRFWATAQRTTPENVLAYHSPLNDRFHKILFYVFLVTPEFIVTALLCGLHVPRYFNVRPLGDQQWSCCGKRKKNGEAEKSPNPIVMEGSKNWFNRRKAPSM
ncbi:hypothetical protein DL96DRAFT_1815672 [Flagelloscypha sp. PMI_526]|nr:hypothetical protein DL96DRAFT_1815672 [Flagelloscypha sp. PMI_526]